MVDNINTNTMVGKVVAVMIAMLFIVVLAFPIANSLGNMGKEDSGTGPITYTNSGDYYYKSTANDDVVHTFDYYSVWETFTEETGHGTAVLKKDNEVIWSFDVDWDANEEEAFIPWLPVGWGAETIYLFNPSQETIISASTEDMILENINSIETELIPEVKYSYEWSFTIQNGVISYTTWENEQVTSDYTMDYLVSTDTGEYVLSELPVKVSADDEILVLDSISPYNNVTNSYWHYYVYGGFSASDLITSSSIESIQLQPFVNGSIETVVTSSINNNLFTISLVESEVSIVVPDRQGEYTITDTVNITKLIVPTTVTIDPSAPVEVTVTNSGQTYTELDDGNYVVNTNILSDSEMSVTINDVEVATVPYDEYGDYPVLCIAFGKTASMWLMANEYFLAVSNGYVNGEQGRYIDNHIWSPRPGAEYVMDYIISNSGDYVYCTDSAKCLNTDNLYISALAETEYYTNVGYIYYGVPTNIGGGIVTDSSWTIDQMNVNSLNRGQYTEIRNVEIMASENGSSSTLDTTINGFFVPKTFIYTESPDSGSDSNGLGGVASTLIKLVPILLIVGVLLIFVMPMINKPS